MFLPHFPFPTGAVSRHLQSGQGHRVPRGRETESSKSTKVRAQPAVL